VRRTNYDPIPKITRIRSNDNQGFVRARGWCEFCNATAAAAFHVHHAIHSRGAGGGDDLWNLCSLCWLCHWKVHNGNVRRADVVGMVEARNLLLDRNEQTGLVFCPGCREEIRPVWLKGGLAFQCSKCATPLPRST
jgi:hypothetical protein